MVSVIFVYVRNCYLLVLYEHAFAILTSCIPDRNISGNSVIAIFRLSVSNDLKVDSERDLRDIGATKIDVHALNKVNSIIAQSVLGNFWVTCIS